MQVKILIILAVKSGQLIFFPAIISSFEMLYAIAALASIEIVLYTSAVFTFDDKEILLV